MAPKLVARHSPSADPDAALEARVFAAQIGWLETSIPDATVEALCRVEVLLSQGLSEASRAGSSSVRDHPSLPARPASHVGDARLFDLRA